MRVSNRPNRSSTAPFLRLLKLTLTLSHISEITSTVLKNKPTYVCPLASSPPSPGHPICHLRPPPTSQHSNQPHRNKNISASAQSEREERERAGYGMRLAPRTRIRKEEERSWFMATPFITTLHYRQTETMRRELYPVPAPHLAVNPPPRAASVLS